MKMMIIKFAVAFSSSPRHSQRGGRYWLVFLTSVLAARTDVKSGFTAKIEQTDRA